MPELPPYSRPPAFMRFPMSYFMVRQVYRFEVLCRSCGRGGHVYLTTLMDKVGSKGTLDEVRLKCIRCRRRDCRITPDVDYKPAGELITFPARPR